MPKKGQEEGGAVRRGQALELRIAGASYRAIGAQLGTSAKTAFYDVQRELAALEKVRRGRAEDLKGIELARLDRMTLALGRKVTGGEERAITAMLRVMERRARLLGLDAAQKLDVNLSPDKVVSRLVAARKRLAAR